MSGSSVAGVGLAAVLAFGPGGAALCSLLCGEGGSVEAADSAAPSPSGSGHHHEGAPAAPPGEPGGAAASAPGGCCEHPAASPPASRIAARAAGSGMRGNPLFAGNPTPRGPARAEGLRPERFGAAGGGGGPPPPVRSAPLVLRL